MCWFFPFSQRAAVEAAQEGVQVARMGHGPVLSGEIDASVYNRTTHSTHPPGAGLVLEVKTDLGVS